MLIAVIVVDPIAVVTVPVETVLLGVMLLTVVPAVMPVPDMYWPAVIPDVEDKRLRVGDPLDVVPVIVAAVFTSRNPLDPVSDNCKSNPLGIPAFTGVALYVSVL